MKAVGYCRVARKDYEQTNSLESMNELIKLYSEKKNYELVRIYSDENVSSTNISKREQLCRLLKDSKKDSFELVLVKSVSTLSRNPKDLLFIINILKENNKKCYFINEDKEIDDIFGLFKFLS